MEDRLKKLEQRLNELETRRIKQEQIIPDSIKARHVGEGVRYIQSGIDTDKPTTGGTPLTGTEFYFDYTSAKLWIWRQSTSSWVSVTLS